MNEKGDAPKAKSVTLANGVTVVLDGRVQRAITFLVAWQDLLNVPSVNGKFALNMAGEDVRPAFEIEHN